MRDSSVNLGDLRGCRTPKERTGACAQCAGTLRANGRLRGYGAYASAVHSVSNVTSRAGSRPASLVGIALASGANRFLKGAESQSGGDGPCALDAMDAPGPRTFEEWQAAKAASRAWAEKVRRAFGAAVRARRRNADEARVLREAGTAERLIGPPPDR
jgi:hypothetical protein